MSQPLPWSEDAETAVVGACLMDMHAVDEAMGVLKPQHFYSEAHRTLWGAFLELRADGEVIDPLTVANVLTNHGTLERVGGKDYLGYLMDVVPTAANIRYHAGIVREHHERRALIRAAEEAVEAARQGKEKAKDVAARLTEGLVGVAAASSTGGFRTISEGIWGALQRVEDRAAGRTPPGVLTGFRDIDEKIGGFRGGDLIVMCSVPGGGKTALGLNLLVNAAFNGDEGAMVSAEMSASELTERLLGNIGMVDSVRLRKGTLDKEEWGRLVTAADQLAKLPLHVDDSPRPSIGEVMARVRALKVKHPGLKLVVVDFIQLIRAGNEEMMALALTNITYDLKGLAKELDLTVVATCQVDASAVEKSESPKPHLHHIRWSQGIREGADFVVMLFRPKMYDAYAEDVMECAFEKARALPPFTARLAWRAPFMRAENHSYQRAA